MHGTSLCVHDESSRSPKSKSYAKASHDAELQSTMEEEIQALAVNKTRDLVDLSRLCKPIGCKWVYKVKYNANGLVNKYKARLVVKGYVQTHDIDNDKTVATVVKITTIRVVLVVAAAREWHLH